jgi:elongation factor 1-alpha
LCKLIGVDQIIVGVNKMDDKSVNYSESRFNEIKSEVTAMLKSAGYKTAKVPFIPMSGYQGENLIEKSSKMPWYKGFDVPVKKGVRVQGHTLLDALNVVARPPVRIVEGPLRMPVSGFFKIKGAGDIVTGRVEQGVVKEGQSVRFEPSGCIGKVFSIEMHHKNVKEAHPGDNVGINIKGIPKENPLKTGEVMIPVEEGQRKVKSFRAVVAVQEHPGQLKSTQGNKKGGFTPSVHIRTGKAPCQMDQIHWKMGPKSTKGAKVEDPLYVQYGDQAEITFTPKLPFYAETFENCPGLGRIAVMDSNSLVMLGKILEIEYC